MRRIHIIHHHFETVIQHGTLNLLQWNNARLTHDPKTDRRRYGWHFFLNDEKTYDHDRFNKLYAKMQAQGTRFVVASGNQYYQLKTFFNQPEVLFLSENGAYCGTADTKLFASTFTTENARKVLDALLTIPELKLSICGVNSAYIRESEGQVWINDTRKYYTHLAIVDNFDQLPDDEILKFAMGCPPEKKQTPSWHKSPKRLKV